MTRLERRPFEPKTTTTSVDHASRCIVWAADEPLGRSTMRPFVTIELVGLLPVLSLCACATTATVSTTHGVYEGQIVSSNRRELTLHLGDETRDVKIAREDVGDIDHPGNVLAVIGGLVTAGGLADLLLFSPLCDVGAGYCVGLATPIGVGLAMLIGGLMTWSASKAAAALKRGRTALPALRNDPVEPLLRLEPEPKGPTCTEEQKTDMRNAGVSESAIRSACE